MIKRANEIAKELVVSGYEFNGSQYLSEGWKLGLSIAGWTLLYGLMYYIIQFISNFIPVIGPLGFSFVVGPGFSAGLILFVHKKYTTNESDFSTVFKGFKYVGHLIIASLLTGLILLGVMIPLLLISFLIIGLDGAEEIISLGQDFSEVTNPIEVFSLMGKVFSAFLPVFFISFIGIGCVSALFLFTNYFIVIGGCSAIEAMGASFKIVKKKFFPICGVLLLLGLTQIIGAIPFLLGLIITAPWAIATIYVIYNKIIIVKMDSDEFSFSDDNILDA